MTRKKAEIVPRIIKGKVKVIIEADEIEFVILGIIYIPKMPNQIGSL